jgi:hypothetical protein
MSQPPHHNPDKISIRNKILHCSGLLGTGDLNDWESEFIASNYNNLIRFGDGFHISEKQDYYLNKIWSKHFANAAALPEIPSEVRLGDRISRPLVELDDDIPF